MADQKYIEVVLLLGKLRSALYLTKLDAEKHGFRYGPQSNCAKALKAFDKWNIIYPKSAARQKERE